MKKINLIKALAMMFVVFVLMSWLIPASSVSSSGIEAGAIQPLGIFDLFRVPYMALTNYMSYGIFFIVLGGLYGVMNKTGAYGNAIDFFVKGFKKNESVALISIVIIFGLLSAFTGLNLVLFILVPFFVTILLKMNFSKLTAIMATVGSILVGNFASIYGFNVSGYINYFFKLDVNDNILIKLILFVASFTLLSIFLIYETRKSKKEKINDLALYDKNEKENKNFIPLMILLDFSILFLLIAGFNWSHSFGVTIFEKLYDEMMKFSIGDFLIFDWLAGTINPIGWWNITDFTIFMVIITIIIAWLYNVKPKEALEGFKTGAKEMFIPALYAVMAHLIMSGDSINATNQANVFTTVTNSVLSIKDGFSYFGAMLLPLATGLLQNDLTNIVYTTSSQVTNIVTDVATYPIFGIAFQTVHSILMLLLPTSVILVAALSYLKVSYLDWLKYVWKFVLGLLVLSIIVTSLMTILI